MSDKLQALDALQQVNPAGLSEADRTYWAQRWAEVQEAAKSEGPKGVSMVAVSFVLRVLVDSARNDTLRTDQSLTQLMAKTCASESVVKRALSVLDKTGVVPILKHGGGPRKQGKQAQATVRWVQFVNDYRQRTEVTSALTEVPSSLTQVPTEPHYRGTTETPTPAQTFHSSHAVGGSRSGGKGKQRENTGSWCDQVAWNVAAAVLAHEKEQGRADRVRDPDAVIRKHKLPAAVDWVQQLMRRTDAQALGLLSPTDRDLIAWGVSEVLQEGTYSTASDACRRAHALWDQQQQRPAMGAG